jgi:hypothetical protein
MSSMRRFVLVIGILLLVLGMIVTVALGYRELVAPLPSSCADFGGPSSLAPSECHKGMLLYIFAFALLAVGVGTLWRKLAK